MVSGEIKSAHVCVFIWWVLICFFVGISFSPLIFLCYHIPLRFLAGSEGPTDKGPAAPVDSRNWPQRLHSWRLLGAGMGHGGWVSSSWTFEVSASAWAEGDTNSPPFPDITSHAILQANSPVLQGSEHMVFWVPPSDQRRPYCSDLF